jgi:hypothetical protein
VPSWFAHEMSKICLDVKCFLILAVNLSLSVRVRRKTYISVEHRDAEYGTSLSDVLNNFCPFL